MKLYIKDSEVISIQEPLSDNGIWNPANYTQVQVRCKEPLFHKFLSPIASRRMSPIIKRAIVTTKMCIEHSEIERPDAIITGTGLGCVEDTEKFLDAMVRNGEYLLQPTSFIQSTHNTISSQIAIQLKCNGFNNTHVHKGISFESALHEAWLLFQLGDINSALVAGNDELTPSYFEFLGKLGYWRESIDSSLSIVRYPGKGTFAGEGSATFILSNKKGNGKEVAIEGVEIVYNSTDLMLDINRFLIRSDTLLDDVDVVMTGRNGDTNNDSIYDQIIPLLGKKEAFYKNLCGEYFTASAFGLYTASKCLLSKSIPSHLTFNCKVIDDIKRILMIHHWQKTSYSFILLSLCGD